MSNIRVPISKRLTKKINVNQATYLQLVSVPGLSDIIAAQILLYRQQHGAFKTLTELLAAIDRTDIWLDVINHRLEV